MVRVVVIDTETTGLKPHEGGNRIIELAAMEIVDGEITGNSYRSYVNPQGRKSNPLALKVHQIQDDFLLDKPTFKELSDDFLEFIEGAELCSYNAAFDFGFLQAEVDRAGIDIVFSRDYKISCLMEDIKYKLGLKRWLKLDSACLRYGIDISTRKVHGALIDAMLAAELFIAFHYQNTKPLDKTPQQKPHSPPEPRPIPRAYKHPLTGQMIQLNYCKNPQCSNYGIPAKNPELDKHGKPKRGLANDYKLTNSAIGKSLTCKRCNTSTRMINNRSFVLESLRNAEEFSLKEPCCPNTGMDADAERGIPNGVRYKTEKRKQRDGSIKSVKVKKPPCDNSASGVISSPEKYKKVGLNRSTVKGRENEASQRMQCLGCETRFNIPINPSMGQGTADINESLFKQLMNKGILNRIQESLELAPTTIYRRIEFFYRQCVQFDQWHMLNNINALNDKMLNLSMDRQHVLVNWTDKSDKRPTKIVNTSTVCNDTRFVFGSTINFDFTSDWQKIRDDARWHNDNDKPDYKRRYAQYVLSDTEVEGDDVGDTLPLKMPTKNLLVHQTYSILAHLEQMKNIFRNAKSTALFADDDEGFELGIGLVLKELIQDNKLYPVLIKAERNNASQMQDKRTWAEQVFRRAGLDPKLIRNTKKLNKAKMTELAQHYWAAMVHQRNLEMGDGKSEWLVHPFPKNKQTIHVRPLVKLNSYVEQFEAGALTVASTHGVDNFFQMLRRRLNMTERPITTATNSQRWNGYAAYNPKWMTMLIEMLRVYNNYVLTDEKTLRNKGVKFLTPMTPAQKLGIAEQRYTVKDIINFSLL